MTHVHHNKPFLSILWTHQEFQYLPYSKNLQSIQHLLSPEHFRDDNDDKSKNITWQNDFLRYNLLYSSKQEPHDKSRNNKY